MKDKTITYLEEDSRIYLKPWMQGQIFFSRTQRSPKHKWKCFVKLDYIKINNLSEDIIKRVKRPPIEQEIAAIIYIYNKELLSRIYKDLLQISKKKIRKYNRGISKRLKRHFIKKR